VTVTVLAGGGDPAAIDRYMAPGMIASIPFYTGDTSFKSAPSITTQTRDGVGWLAVSFNQLGTLGYVYQTGYINLTAAPSMAEGVYAGTVTLANYVARTIPVTMRVTTQPIAVASQNSIIVRIAEGGPAAAYPFVPPITFTNSGMGNLQLLGVTASGEGVGAALSGGSVVLNLSPGSRTPGVYNDAKVTVQCNAANCPFDVTVRLEVTPRGPPVIQYPGVMDNAAYEMKVAPGDVCILKGDQLSTADPAIAALLPLPQRLGGASVLVNNVYAPLYYSSAGQIAFQMPLVSRPGRRWCRWSATAC
jgi:hypothetical protein